MGSFIYLNTKKVKVLFDDSSDVFPFCFIFCFCRSFATVQSRGFGEKTPRLVPGSRRLNLFRGHQGDKLMRLRDHLSPGEPRGNKI